MRRKIQEDLTTPKHPKIFQPALIAALEDSLIESALLADITEPRLLKPPKRKRPFSSRMPHIALQQVPLKVCEPQARNGNEAEHAANRR